MKTSRKPKKVYALRQYRPIRSAPDWAYRLDYPMDAVDRLNLWWRECERSEIRPPDWADVWRLFVGWTDERLIEGLNYMRSTIPCLAAMGARADTKFLPHILPCRAYDRSDDWSVNREYLRRKREMAYAALAQITPYPGVYDLWDFLFVAMGAYQQCETPRQLSLF